MVNRGAENRRSAGLSAAPAGSRTIVWLVISRVMAMVTPRSTSIEASVMRNEGSRVRTTSQPLMAPRMSASANVSTTASAGSRWYWVIMQGEEDAGDADHRAQRQVELAGDHEQRDGCAQDAHLGRDLEPPGDADGPQEPVLARPG